MRFDIKRVNKHFNLNTIEIISIQSSKGYPIKVLVRGKLIGGKRFKRDWIWLNQDEHRHIKLRELDN
jgi:hypothetical protein